MDLGMCNLEQEKNQLETENRKKTYIILISKILLELHLELHEILLIE